MPSPGDLAGGPGEAVVLIALTSRDGRLHRAVLLHGASAVVTTTTVH
jgi:hypothetical protein